MPRLPPPPPPLTFGRILRVWWPLAASWACMGAELPIFTAFVARLPDAPVHLAAYGSVVFPLALLIEAPIIMLLAASTALARDRQALGLLRRVMTVSGAGLTLLHALVCATPLYELVARDLLGVPQAVLGPGRTGLWILLPWTWAIAHRRLHQGLLIRAERSGEIVLGTLTRLAALALTCGGLSLATDLSGIAVGASGVAVAVCAEAAFVRWRVGPVLHTLPGRDLRSAPLTFRAFFRFYLPLALTPLLTLLNQPLGAAAMSRMPRALGSLAAWPPVHGFVFLPRSLGFAFNEVVVALLERPGAERALRRFGIALAAATALLLLGVALTPLGRLWFATLQGLEPALSSLAAGALVFAAPLPALQALQSWYQGLLVHRRRTRGITEAVGVYLVVCAAVLYCGVRWQGLPGLSFTLLAFAAGALTQTFWLAYRASSSAGPRPPVLEASSVPPEPPAGAYHGASRHEPSQAR